jgi:L-fuconolactonase
LTIPIIDSHVHIYNPRDAGVEPADGGPPMPHPTSPQDLREVSEPLGVAGAVVVEASSELEENQRLLDLAESDPFIVALVGNLDAGKPGFADRLAGYAGNPRFRGVRVGTPWCPLDLENSTLIADMHTLADAGLTLDVVRVGGGNLQLLQMMVALGDRVPNLRIIIDHLPYDLPDDAMARAGYQRLLRELANRPGVYAKVSNILPRQGPIPSDTSAYAPMLDGLFAIFGTDRLMYGSNYPVSARVAPYERAFGVLADYFAPKDPELAEKFFARNARTAYNIPG